MKRLCFFFIFMLLMHSCFMDIEHYEDYYGVAFENNSDSVIMVGFYFLSDSEPVCGFLGSVDKHSSQLLHMMLAYDMGNKSYGSFFNHSKTDTLTILVTDDHNKIGYWEKCKNDSLLLKRYDLTKDNVDTTKQDVYIKYP